MTAVAAAYDGVDALDNRHPLTRRNAAGKYLCRLAAGGEHQPVDRGAAAGPTFRPPPAG